MRSPLCCDSGEICPEDQGIGSESESNCKILAIEKSYGKCHTYKTAIFGICLENLMGTTPKVAPQIPFILSRLCRYIEQHGLHYRQLFLEDEKDLVESLKLEFNESGDAPLESAGNVASVAKLLIVFFEELPEPLIPITSQPDFIQGMERLSLNTTDCVAHLKQSLSKLPDSAYQVIKYLSRFLFQVSSHKEYNGMSSDNLGIIFGPVIFRLPSNDPIILSNVKTVVNNFVQNYHSIFEDDHKCSSCDDDDIHQKSNTIMSETCLRRQIPCPSTVVPVMTLLPLSVVIPTVDSDIVNEKKSKQNVPVLLIEGQHDGSQKATEGKQNAIDVVKEINAINRKRKERRLSGEDLQQQRSSSEERPATESLACVEKMDTFIRRCNSHEEMKEDTAASDVKLEAFMSQDKREVHNLDCFASDSRDMVVNETNHSPHPPNAKRREIESNNLDYNFLTFSWMESSPFDSSDNRVATGSSLISEPANSNLCSKQNSVAEIEATSCMDYDASEISETGEDDSLVNSSEDISNNPRSGIRRSSSCPVPTSDNYSEEESSSLSLSWSMLFESPDSEPLRSEHRYSWPLTKEVQEDTALLSPTVQSLRKSSSFNEAPLSPSAYRSYLSHRSHLDPSIPPSPPVEQEDFAKNLIESNAVSDSIKQLTKKIHSIKKRIRRFDEKFEMEFGYKPSHAEKANNPEAKKLMNDLHKARKELKALKEESHLEQVSPASWHSSKSSHILGDSTNQVIKDIAKLKPTVEETYDVAMKSLSDERKLAKRPDSVDDMTNEQVKDEKLSIQRALLDFESIHGKPCSKAERNAIRPLYDRYRNVKKLLVRSGSFPGAMSKSKDVCSELQPILEHETMDFISPQHRTEVNSSAEIEEPTIPETEEKPSEELKTTFTLDSNKNSNVLAMKYDNSSIHELPLSEMVFQLQQVKSQKRHLRKILREFESEFLRLNGRKVQKEDKAPVDALYVEYKHVKARLKLLEALISKHDQHQLM